MEGSEVGGKKGRKGRKGARSGTVQRQRETPAGCGLARGGDDKPGPMFWPRSRMSAAAPRPESCTVSCVAVACVDMGWKRAAAVGGGDPCCCGLGHEHRNAKALAENEDISRKGSPPDKHSWQGASRRSTAHCSALTQQTAAEDEKRPEEVRSQRRVKERTLLAG